MSKLRKVRDADEANQLLTAANQSGLEDRQFVAVDAERGVEPAPELSLSVTSLYVHTFLRGWGQRRPRHVPSSPTPRR